VVEDVVPEVSAVDVVDSPGTPPPEQADPTNAANSTNTPSLMLGTLAIPTSH
jgi:hypothetical protein